MALVVRAVVDTLHLAAGEVLKAVVANLTRTAFEISVETSVAWQDARVTKRIALRQTTAMRFNEALASLDNDYYWDPEVKTQLRDGLVDDLRSEMRRLSFR